MNSYRYRIGVSMIADQKGEPIPEHTRSLYFEAANHDDILAIADRIRSRRYFDNKDSIALAIGFKLFAEVMLQHRNDPLFDGLQEPVRDFMQRLKSLPDPATPTNDAQPDARPAQAPAV